MQNPAFHKILAITLLGACLPLAHTYAQTTGGDVKTEDIDVYKDTKVVLPQANRIFEKIPVSAVDGEKKPIRYEFVERKLPVQTPEFSPTVSMPDDGSSKENSKAAKYNNIIRAGFGNYGHTFLEAHAGLPMGDNSYHGIYVKHNNFRLGPVGANYSGISQNLVKVHSRTSFDAVKLEGSLGWERRGFDFYGFVPENYDFPESLIFNSYNRFNFIGTLSNADKDSKIDYTFKSNLSYLFTHLKANELVWTGGGNAVFPITDNLSASLDGTLVLAQRQDSTTLYRNLYKLKPTFQYKTDKFTITAGLNVINDREKNTFNNSYLYPIVKIDVQPIQGLKFFVGYEGDVYANNLTSFLNENQWLNRFVDLKNTRKTGDYYIGSKAFLDNGLALEAKLSYATYKDFYVFNNSGRDSTRFEALYSNDTTTVKVTNFMVQASYQIPDVFRSNLKIDVNIYNGLGNLGQAWHRPNFSAVWSNTFTVKQKLLVSSDLFILTGLRGKNFVTNKEIKIDPIIDLNFKFTYIISDHFNVFVSANNVLGKNYQRYLYYPVQGVNFLGGLSYSF
ncbi:MAG: TonB-dependent receptor [Emticicia sp.]|nr:TonB-dependent receptor [Emticicia sp.]